MNSLSLFYKDTTLLMNAMHSKETNEMKSFTTPLRLFTLLVFCLCLGAQGGSCNKNPPTDLKKTIA